MSDAVEMDDQERHWYEIWKDAEDKAKRYARIAADAKAELKDLFSHATALADGKPVFGISRTTTRRFDQSRFRKERPEEYEEYRVESETVSLFHISAEDAEGVTTGEQR